MKQWFINRYNGIVFGRTSVGEYLNAIYSFRYFLKYSFTNSRLRRRENLKAFIIKQYHIVEKGLSLPNPRENFGIPKIKLLLSKIKMYEKRFGFDDVISVPVRGCLKEYLVANPNLAKKDNELKVALDMFLGEEKSQNHNIGGTKLYKEAELKSATNIDFKRFVETRSSVRDFKDIKVDIADINEAVEIARNAPSVCNRQKLAVALL